MSNFRKVVTGCAVAAMVALLACSPGGGSHGEIAGAVTYGDGAVTAAKVELYLQAGRFRASAPFAEAFTDGQGEFSITVPGGRYYIAVKGEGPDGLRLFGEFPGNPVELKAGETIRKIEISLEAAVSSMDYRGPADSGIEGMVHIGGQPAEGGYVYIYSDESSNLMGPGYLTAAPLMSEGRYRINLHPGRYWVAVRMKAGGRKAGLVTPGDATATYSGNPAVVEASRFTRLDDIVLHPADPSRMATLEEARRARNGETGLSGSVIDRDGATVPGIQVILYDHPQMIGRPVQVIVSDEEGRFHMPVATGGRYYLGAREGRSGPRHPGELAGGYEETADHSVDIVEGLWNTGLIIRVEEVW